MFVVYCICSLICAAAWELWGFLKLSEQKPLNILMIVLGILKTITVAGCFIVGDYNIKPATMAVEAITMAIVVTCTGLMLKMRKERK